MAHRMMAEEAAGAGWGEGTQRCHRPRATEAGGWASGWWEVHVSGASLLLVLSREISGGGPSSHLPSFFSDAFPMHSDINTHHDRKIDRAMGNRKLASPIIFCLHACRRERENLADCAALLCMHIAVVQTMYKRFKLFFETFNLIFIKQPRYVRAHILKDY